MATKKQTPKKPDVKAKATPAKTTAKCNKKPVVKGKATPAVKSKPTKPVVKAKPKRQPSKIEVIRIQLQLLESLIWGIQDYAKAKKLYPQTAVRGIDVEPSKIRAVEELEYMYEEAALLRDNIADLVRRLDVLDPIPECED